MILKDYIKEVVSQFDEGVSVEFEVRVDETGEVYDDARQILKFTIEVLKEK